MNSLHPRMRLLLAIFTAVLVAFAAGCASRTDGRLGDDDQVFAMQAAYGGRFEVDAGALATTRAASAEVRAFGQLLVDHHQAANAELAALLQARGLQPPLAPSAGMAARMARLAPLSGAAFDREFIRTAGIAAHQQQIALFLHAGRDVADPALRAWFIATLPTLRAHLEAAQGLAMLPN